MKHCNSLKASMQAEHCCTSTTAESRAKIWYQYIAFKPLHPPGGTGCCLFKGGGSVVVDLMYIVTPIVGFCNCSMFCCALLYVPSSFAIILTGKRELVALLILSSWCLVIDVWLFIAVPWVGLQFVIVVFSDHTHLLFLWFKTKIFFFMFSYLAYVNHVTPGEAIFGSRGII